MALITPFTTGMRPAFVGGGGRASVSSEVGNFVILALFAVLTSFLAESSDLGPLVNSLGFHLLNYNLSLVLVRLLSLEVLQLLGLTLDLLTRVLTLF